MNETEVRLCAVRAHRMVVGLFEDVDQRRIQPPERGSSSTRSSYVSSHFITFTWSRGGAYRRFRAYRTGSRQSRRPRAALAPPGTRARGSPGSSAAARRTAKRLAWAARARASRKIQRHQLGRRGAACRPLGGAADVRLHHIGLPQQPLRHVEPVRTGAWLSTCLISSAAALSLGSTASKAAAATARRRSRRRRERAAGEGAFTWATCDKSEICTNGTKPRAGPSWRSYP